MITQNILDRGGTITYWQTDGGPTFEGLLQVTPEKVLPEFVLHGSLVINPTGCDDDRQSPSISLAHPVQDLPQAPGYKSLPQAGGGPGGIRKGQTVMIRGLFLLKIGLCVGIWRDQTGGKMVQCDKTQRAPQLLPLSLSKAWKRGPREAHYSSSLLQVCLHFLWVVPLAMLLLISSPQQRI